MAPSKATDEPAERATSRAKGKTSKAPPRDKRIRRGFGFLGGLKKGTPDVILGLVPRTHTVILQRMPYFVYMMASRKGGTIYTGVTNDLSRRAFEHREGSASKFTRKYKVRRLVWYEEYDSVGDAIQREKNIKRYYRQWKINLIESINPEWHDLYRHLG